MSEREIEGFQACAAAARRGDVEGVLEWLDPEIEFVPLRAAIGGEYFGHDAMRRFFADNAETFEVFEPYYDDVRDLGDRVVAFGTLRTRGRGSGVETEVPSAVLTRWLDGRVVYFKDFGDRQLALEAAGLSG